LFYLIFYLILCRHRRAHDQGADCSRALHHEGIYVICYMLYVMPMYVICYTCTPSTSYLLYSLPYTLYHIPHTSYLLYPYTHTLIDQGGRPPGEEVLRVDRWIHPRLPVHLPAGRLYAICYIYVYIYVYVSICVYMCLYVSICVYICLYMCI
jgi:hypothetical protein